MFSAFLDANALVPISLVDTILRCADEELFRPLWSERILSEAHQAIARIEPSLADSRVEYRLNRMKAAFPEAMVHNYQSLEDQIVIPDPDDRHVVAAAYVGSADLIVTNNLKDFPDSVLTQFGLEAVTPDRFLQDMLDLAPTIVHRVIVPGGRCPKPAPLHHRCFNRAWTGWCNRLCQGLPWAVSGGELMPGSLSYPHPTHKITHYSCHSGRCVFWHPEVTRTGAYTRIV